MRETEAAAAGKALTNQTDFILSDNRKLTQVYTHLFVR